MTVFCVMVHCLSHGRRVNCYCGFVLQFVLGIICELFGYISIYIQLKGKCYSGFVLQVVLGIVCELFG